MSPLMKGDGTCSEDHSVGLEEASPCEALLSIQMETPL